MELLTGKCKKEFEFWFLKQEYGERIGNDIYYVINETYGCSFYNLTFSMQYGVYVDFFIMYNIFISSIPLTIDVNRPFVSSLNKEYRFKDVDTIKEAQLLTIRKSNDIFNQKKYKLWI